MGYLLPWQVTPARLAAAVKTGQKAGLSAEQASAVFLDGRANSYRSPSFAILAIWIAVFTFAVIRGVYHLDKRVAPQLHGRISSACVFPRSALLHAPLFRSRHHESYPLIKLGSAKLLSVRAPLRSQTLLIGLLVLANLLGFLVGYKDVPDPANPPSKQRVKWAADRAAALILGQIPLLILTSGRNSPLALLSQMDFSEAMVFHRWIARCLWTCVNIHLGCFTIRELQTGEYAESFSFAYWNWGIGAASMVWGLTFLSISELRKRHYEVFLSIHIVCAIMMLVFAYMHISLLASSSFWIFIVLIKLSAALWGFDRFVRLCLRLYFSNNFLYARFGRTPLRPCTIEKFPANVYRVRIQLPIQMVKTDDEGPASSGSARIAAGHSIRMLMPRIQWTGDHPFTVVRAARDHSDASGKAAFVELLVKKQDGMTKHLAAHHRENAEGTYQDAAEKGNVARHQTQLSVALEGPYGHLPAEIRTSDQVLVFAGGIGITYCMPILEQVARHHPSTSCKLLWVSRDFGMLEAIREQLLALVQALRDVSAGEKQDRTASRKLCIDFIDTGRTGLVMEELDKSGGGVNEGDGASQDEKTPGESEQGGPLDFVTSAESGAGSNAFDWSSFAAHLDPYVSLSYKPLGQRPSLAPNGHVEVSDEQKKSQRLTVVACGPGQMCDEARLEALGALQKRDWANVVYAEECFDW